MSLAVQNISGMIGCAMLLSLTTSCDVHEFPDEPDEAAVCLKLHFATDMPQWEYPVTESRTYVPSRDVQTDGYMRYIIRLYPGTSDSRSLSSRAEHEHEFIFTRSVADGYDAEFVLDDIPSGEYTLMAWADLIEKEGEIPLYNAENFAQVKLQTDEHQGCNDYRDAFRGSLDLTIKPGIVVRGYENATVEMERPMAKFEFITTDLDEFIDKEILAAISRGETTHEAIANAPSKSWDMSKYKIMFYYIGFMPTTFNMFTDRPSDSTTGVAFPGRFMRLEGNEASLGFDYVFVNHIEAKVAVQIGIFDDEGNRLSLTSPIDVPLHRSEHTLIKGKFMLQNASGGVGIDPSFSGEHNIFI